MRKKSILVAALAASFLAAGCNAQITSTPQSVVVPSEAALNEPVDSLQAAQVLNAIARAAEATRERSSPSSKSSGISEQEARDLVLAQIAGAQESDFTQFRQDRENGQKIYEGELHCNGATYDFEISAVNGDLLSWGWKTIPEPGNSNVDIGMATARALMVEEVPGSADFDIVKCERDDTNGVPTYEGDLRFSGRIYEFEIVASTGEICKWSYEPAYAAPVPEVTADAAMATALPVASFPTASQMPVQTPTLAIPSLPVSGTAPSAAEPDVAERSGDIGRDAAIGLVLDRVPGASSANLRDFERDFDDGILIYEGELKYRGVEYEFEIRASDGKFLEWDADYDD